MKRLPHCASKTYVCMCSSNQSLLLVSSSFASSACAYSSSSSFRNFFAVCGRLSLSLCKCISTLRPDTRPPNNFKSHRGSGLRKGRGGREGRREREALTLALGAHFQL